MSVSQRFPTMAAEKVAVLRVVARERGRSNRADADARQG
jgi:hypothetical protein